MRNVSLIVFALCVAMSSSAMATTMVNIGIPEDIPGITGQIAIAPIEIDDADGILGFSFVVTYDTTLLDLSNADVQPGSLTASGWSLVPNVDDSLGQATIAGFSSTNPLAAGPGSLLELDFHVTGTSGTSDLILCGTVNDIAPCFSYGSIDVVPEPSTVVSLLGLLFAGGLVFARRR